MEFETVIGLEVHVQLSTQSKMFCNASAAYGGEPNEYIDPVTLGLPGALPVANRRAVEFAIMLGLATNSEIRRFNRFARKHYFYPDLPKGYQISQFDEPICERGSVEFYMGETKRTIGLKRIHMEEDRTCPPPPRARSASVSPATSTASTSHRCARSRASRR